MNKFIEMVSVGNARNKADINRRGRVNYKYQIGKYEVSIEQYSAFLNAVAATDPYGLYNPQLMTNPLTSGITRSGEKGEYKYSAVPGSEGFPITGINWFDAARFINWLSNGQPTGPSDVSTTEDGSYTLNGRTSGLTAGRNTTNPNTQNQPLYVLPTEDEWYKAAYYNPKLNKGRGGYYLYATQSYENPGNAIGSQVNQANYILDSNGFYSVTQEPFADTSNNYLSSSGAFTASASYYGTFDQNGGVWEFAINTNDNVAYAIMRGGAWTSVASLLQSGYKIGISTSTEAVNGGFRVAQAPAAAHPKTSKTAQIDRELSQHIEKFTELGINKRVTPSKYPIHANSESSKAVKIDFARIGDTNNAPDPLTGLGQVKYNYHVGTNCITIEQYTKFLNSVAKDDKHGLFSQAMQNDLNIAGISRSGKPGTYSYTVMENTGDSGKRPITYVSWLDAARFSNWMSNGQPTGSQNKRTTEDGAYRLKRFSLSGKMAPARNIINPNTGKSPLFFIPTEDEWYKAAYYSSSMNGNSGGYFLFPTQSNQPPTSLPDDQLTNQANLANNFIFHNSQSNIYNPATNYLTDTGAFVNSSSFYKTFDQAGLVYEWNDLLGKRSVERGLRGGYWFSAGQSTQSTTFSLAVPGRESNDTGFRLVSTDLFSELS